jgi:hypothetical protein
MYTELGYLAPPNPPDELERRRALYKSVIFSPSNFPGFRVINAHFAYF